MMLIGTWEQPIDPSGRLKLPAPLRPLLGDGLVITRGFDRCLQIFPHDAWSALAIRVRALPIAGAPERQLRRLLFAAAMTLRDEGDDIVRLPRQLCSYATIAERAVIVGLDSYLELWAAERWASLTAELEGAAGSWPDRNTKLGSLTI